ncbi:MAG: LytTR family DNA-binding domain-containing protein [Spirochaetia bacterium]|nr:LytTR family DNA-binding domain-containing protein [Spirochaetia bacterium]
MQQNRLKVLIVDDETAARNVLLNYCSRNPALHAEDAVCSGREFVEKVTTKQYDLIFMDIELRDSTGTLALQQVPRLPPVIVTTGHPEYAVEAFELGMMDFLLKPFTFERFMLSVNRVIESAERNAGDKDFRTTGVSVRNGDHFYFVPFQEIIYVTSRGKGSIIHTTSTEHQTSRLLMSMNDTLPKHQFLRVHKQFVINLNFVSHLQQAAKGDYIAFLKDEENSQIPVSRTYSGELRTRLGLG